MHERRGVRITTAALAACVLLCAQASARAARPQTRKPKPAASQQPTQQAAPAQGAQAKTPISLNGLVKALSIGGLKTKELIEEVESRGVAFEMSRENESSLRSAGAEAPLVEAARKNYRGPVDRQELQAMLYLSVLRPPRFTTAEIIENVTKRGVNFSMTRDDEAQLLKAGATQQTLAAVRANYRPGAQSAKQPAPPAGNGGGNTGGGDAPSSGAGMGGGIGPGEGGGYGPGRGGNTGGGDRNDGGGVGGGGVGGGGGGSGVDYNRPFRNDEVTRKAIVTSKPEPSYTEEARKNNVAGTVRLAVILSASGEVKIVRVIKGLPDGLTEKAISAAKQIKFQPAQKDGRNVSQYVMVEYNFNIY